MKVLKFSDPLPELVLKGEKNTTWRINDQRGITKGDMLSLCRNDGTEFAKAKVIWTNETMFGKLAPDDKEGHEKFSSDREMYETYSKYYNTKVTADTKVKVIKFELL